MASFAQWGLIVGALALGLLAFLSGWTASRRYDRLYGDVTDLPDSSRKLPLP